MKTNKINLLKKLDMATDRAVSFAIENNYPIQISKKSTLIGNMFVERNANGFYNITLTNKKIMYEDISVLDIAIIIAQRYNTGEFATVRKVLMLEEQFSKYHNDMIHYLNCLRGARKHQDIERMAILEDKFQVAEILAKSIRNSIMIFKRVK